MPSPHRHGVLIVDDHEDLAEAVAGLLDCEGFEARVASRAAAGLQILREGFRPCLILLDVMMPEMSGETFLVEQRHDPELATIPVALFTGVANPKTVAALLGVAGCFPKPLIEPMAVVRFVERICPGR
jgi:CheY-like chemotaxis protein